MAQASIPKARSAPVPGLAQGRLLRVLRASALPVVFLAVFLVAWEAIVVGFRIPPYLVPAPSDVVAAFVRGFARGNYLWHMLVTLTEAVTGFLAGSALGIAIGVMIVVFPTLERIVYPYIVALQTLPKVAIAPLIIVWFGFGITSKIIIVALVSLFPVLVNVMAGLKAIDQDRLDLMTSLSASRWQVLRYLRFPNALPFIFAGLNTAIVFSVIGAIVGEFVGATQGIGFLVLQANFALDIAGAFSLFVVLSLMGVTLHTILKVIQSRVVFWTKAEEMHAH